MAQDPRNRRLEEIDAEIRKLVGINSPKDGEYYSPTVIKAANVFGKIFTIKAREIAGKISRKIERKRKVRVFLESFSFSIEAFSKSSRHLKLKDVLCSADKNFLKDNGLKI